MSTTATYHSQIGQDFLLDTAVFRGMRDGVFVDIGAHDGETLSNTLMFERDRGWSGICVEANPALFPLLSSRRRVPSLNVAVSDHDGVVNFIAIDGYGSGLSGLVDDMDHRHVERIERETADHGSSKQTISVPCRRLDKILAEHRLREVHLLSVDTEGSEASILRSLDGGAFVHVVDVECNYRSNISRLADALGPDFAMAARHQHDVFFINRRSRFYGRRQVLRFSCAGWRFSRRFKKLFRFATGG